MGAVTPKFSHVFEAIAHDVHESDSLSSYRARSHESLLSLWEEREFEEVPNGTSHGARDNGDGMFLNLPFPPASESEL